MKKTQNKIKKYQKNPLIRKLVDLVKKLPKYLKRLTDKR